MWPRLRKQFDVEREQLHHLLDVHKPLLEKCISEEPTDIELSALATMLHSFYTGIENIFKRIAVEIDSAPPVGETWHRDLLSAMAVPTKNRTAVISESLRDRLRDYLEFRHVFRHAYSIEMAQDVVSCSRLPGNFRCSGNRGRIFSGIKIAFPIIIMN